MATSTFIVILIIAVPLLWGLFFGGRLPQAFRDRTCQGRGWRQAFPSASKKEIREFLTVFVEAFAFSHNERLKLCPEDSILLVYRALYPSKWMPDSLELETLAKDVEAKYGVTLEAIWHEDLSLGELFANTRKAVQP